nr:hypothetical protein [Tanacetum cinerariifolium]
MQNQSDVQNHLVEIQADDHDLLVSSDNENDDMLGYEFEKYSDDEDTDGTNHAEDADGINQSDMKLVKRSITRQYKFRRKYGKPGGIKIKFENKEIEVDEEPPRGIMWLKGMVNKDGEFTDDKIRSVGDKLKEADDKIKEGTLNLDDGTNTMTVVFVKEKGGYARGVGSGVTYKRRERQQKDVLVKKLSTKMTEKDALVKELSNEMTETKRMLSQLMNQLAAQRVQLNLSSQLQVPSNVTLMGTYEVDETQSSVVVRDKDARIQKRSNGLVTSEKEPVKTVGPKKMPKSRRNGYQDSQSQGNVPPTQELLIASKCNLWHLKKLNIVALGTVYKSDGKQMLYNQALPNDYYKVSVDSSLVDAACIPDIGNNGLKTVKHSIGLRKKYRPSLKNDMPPRDKHLLLKKSWHNPLMESTFAIHQLAYDAMPDKLDEYLYIGDKTSGDSLEVFEFKQPEFKSYRPKSCEIESENDSEDIPNELKEYPDAPLVKDRVSDNQLGK